MIVKHYKNANILTLFGSCPEFTLVWKLHSQAHTHPPFELPGAQRHLYCTRVYQRHQQREGRVRGLAGSLLLRSLFSKKIK
jgi:hypothetical protein